MRTSRSDRQRERWSAAAAHASRFRDRRVFLAGDAAHVMPPTGGFGGNTGIGDAHNLAWKLAALVPGTAGAGLLDTYDAERRPVCDLVVGRRHELWAAGRPRRCPGEPGHHGRGVDRGGPVSRSAGCFRRAATTGPRW